jgi:hypothetical protein
MGAALDRRLENLGISSVTAGKSGHFQSDRWKMRAFRMRPLENEGISNATAGK